MKKRFLALALGTLAFGVTLGGVKMGFGHQDAMMVKAEVKETVYKSLSFPDDKDCLLGNNQYTETNIATKGTDSYTIEGFSNNNWAWDSIRCGRKKYASTNLINTNFAIDKAVSKVTLDLDGSPENATSIKLYAADNDKFTNKTLVGEFKCATGEQSVTVSPWLTNQYYSIEFICPSKSNGYLWVKGVSFWVSEEQVPESPIKSISATRKEPDAVFYAGDKVTLDDFVITATHEDTQTSVLESNVTIENPVLVEGENVIKFHYVSGETSLACQLVVNAIKGNFYTKSTATADIVAGKKIYIANTNGGVTKILDKQNDNNRAEIEVKTSGDGIVAQDTYTSLLVLPAKNGTFALYDEKEMGVLYAAGSGKGNNYLRTEKVFEDINANSFAKLSCANEVWTIEFTGSNTNNSLRHNNSSPLFSCYASGQIAPSIYVSPDAPVTFGTETWAETFLAKLNEICDPTGNTALTEAKWSEAKATFDALSIPDKMAIKYGNFQGEKMKQALAGYNFIINTKYTALYDFLGRRTTTKANALMLPGATDSTTWTLVGIGAVTIAASASLLFFRRKKSN